MIAEPTGVKGKPEALTVRDLAVPASGCSNLVEAGVGVGWASPTTINL